MVTGPACSAAWSACLQVALLQHNGLQVLAQALQHGPFGKRVRAAGAVGVMCDAHPIVRAELPAFIGPAVQLLAERVAGKLARGPCHPCCATRDELQQ